MAMKPALTRDEIRLQHVGAHRRGSLPKIAADPELRAFIEARFACMTFAGIEAAVAAHFPPDRRTNLSAIHRWWQKMQRGRGMTGNRPPAPPPTAQIAPFVQVLGIEEAICFILTYGGAELDIWRNPRDSNALVQMLGREAVEALADLTVPRRIPLAKPWLAAWFYA